MDFKMHSTSSDSLILFIAISPENNGSLELVGITNRETIFMPEVTDIIYFSTEVLNTL